MYGNLVIHGRAYPWFMPGYCSLLGFPFVYLLPLLRENLKHMLPFGLSTICTFKEVCVAQHLICDIRLGILHVCFKHMTCLIGYL